MKKIIIAAAVLATTSAFAADTKTCKGCHGQNFENKAMGQSKVVKDLTKDEIITSLKGYRDTAGFGHTNMKGAMAPQAKKLSDADIEAIAAEIKK